MLLRIAALVVAAAAGGQVCSVLDYGAKGDNITEDTAVSPPLNLC